MPSATNWTLRYDISYVFFLKITVLRTTKQKVAKLNPDTADDDDTRVSAGPRDDGSDLHIAISHEYVNENLRRFFVLLCVWEKNEGGSFSADQKGQRENIGGKGARCQAELTAFDN